MSDAALLPPVDPYRPEFDLRSLPAICEQAFAEASDRSRWFADSTSILTYGAMLEERSSLVRGIVLAVLEKHWDEIPPEATGHQEFRAWACQIAGKHWKTLDNWIRIVRALYFDGVELPERVRYVVEKGSQREEVEVPFDPQEVGHSKLLTALHRIREGEMRDEDWGALANPQVSWDAFLEQMHAHPPASSKRNTFRTMGQVLYLKRPAVFGGQEWEVCEFDYSAFYDRDHPAHDTVRTMLDFLRAN